MSAVVAARGLERLSLNQATITRASLRTAVELTARAGIPAIGVWREGIAEEGLEASARLVRDAGVRVSSVCRGGFFTAADPAERRAAHEQNLRAIEEAAALGAPALVLVAGGIPAGTKDLAGARERVREAIAALVEPAASAGVRLAIEPLHPMYAADRAVVSTLGQALGIAEAFPAPTVGVVVDAFHVWWDPDLAEQVARAGAGGRIASYQVCDWVTPIAPDALLSRGLPGDGWVDVPALTRLVSAAGYDGDVEVEVFRQEVWDADPAAVVELVAARHRELVAPHLA